jgi:DNA-binding MarR family transcriptional regulator
LENLTDFSKILFKNFRFFLPGLPFCVDLHPNEVLWYSSHVHLPITENSASRKEASGVKRRDRFAPEFAQYQYLYCLYKQPADRRTAKDLILAVGAPRSTAYRNLDALVAKGFLLKDKSAYALSETGRKIIETDHATMIKLVSWLRGDFGYDDAEATDIAMRLLCGQAFPTAFVLKMADRGAVYGAVRAAAAQGRNRGLSLPDGQYEVPFEVCRPAGRVKSMGDAGFFKPAKLFAEAERYILELRAKPFSHRSAPDKLTRGVLARFWYRADGDWVEAKKTEKRWFVPGGAIEVLDEDGEFVGRVRFRAWATKSCGMPEGEGDIVLLLGRRTMSEDFFTG